MHLAAWHGGGTTTLTHYAEAWPGPVVIINRAQMVAALPGYTLGDEIGAGSFGLVVAGWHRRLQRDVAIKVVAAGRRSRGRAEPVAAEGRILASLDHPHIVRVYDHVDAGDMHLIIMEMLAGGTLTRRLLRLGQREASAVGLAVADALSAAHARGVLHRDIKPDNVLFDGSGVPKVVDFGIAKLIRGSAATASRVFGTPMFMAPEQFVAGRLGPYTDLYALGVVLYLLMAGHAPFEGAALGPAGTAAVPPPGQYRDRHLLGDRPPAPVGVPGAVADVILRALDRDPALRPPSARDFALDLARAAADAYGPGWLAGTGIPVRIDDEVRAAAERPSALAGLATGALILPPPADIAVPAAGPTIIDPRAARLDGDTDPESEESTAGPTAGPLAQIAPLDGADGRPPADGDRQGHDGRHGRPGMSWRRSPQPHRRHVAAAVALLLSGAVGTVLTVVIRHENGARPLGPPLTGHTDWVGSVALSPDGRILTSSSKDRTIRLWDVTNPSSPRQLGGPLTGHTDWAVSVAFSLDGRILASGSKDRTIRLWDVTNPSSPRQLGGPLTGHTDGLMSVAFSSDERTLASSSKDRTVRLWDVTNPSSPRQLGGPLTGHTDWVWSVAFSSDKRILASASADGTVRLWNVTDRSNPRPIGQPLTGHTGAVYEVVFAPDSRTLASGGKDSTVRLWDVTDPTAPRPIGQPLTGHASTVWSAAFSPDGHTLASGSADGTVRLWNVTDRSNPRPIGQPLTGHTSFVVSVAFAPDGRTLASGSWDKTVRLWTVG